MYKRIKCVEKHIMHNKRLHLQVSLNLVKKMKNKRLKKKKLDRDKNPSC